MKKTFITILIATSSPAFAEQTFCEAWSGYAKQVMQNRQLNIDLTYMLNKAGEMQGLEKMAQQVVIDAYERPLFAVEENRAKEVMRFKNQIMLECFKARQ